MFRNKASDHMSMKQWEYQQRCLWHLNGDRIYHPSWLIKASFFYISALRFRQAKLAWYNAVYHTSTTDCGIAVVSMYDELVGNLSNDRLVGRQPSLWHIQNHSLWHRKTIILPWMIPRAAWPALTDWAGNPQTESNAEWHSTPKVVRFWCGC